MDAGAYVSALINQPWARDGRHCARLVKEVERDLFGRALPETLAIAPPMTERPALFVAAIAQSGWHEIDAPEHGAVALMHAVGTPREDLIHAGVYLALDRGGVLHCDFPQGVVFDSLVQLTALRHRVPRWFVP
jgi:hypothetical protein